MKKAFLLFPVVLILTGVMWFNVSASNGSSIATTVYSKFFTDTRAGERVHAEFYTANASLQKLQCVGTETPGYVSCNVPEEYAGQQLPVQLTKNGIMYVSVVGVPAK